MSGVHLHLLATRRAAHIFGPIEVDQRLVEKLRDPCLWKAVVRRTVDIDRRDFDDVDE